jgi:serine/threonine protein kinase
LARESDRPLIDLRAGEEVAGYRVIECVGRGGMGRVYRAVQPRLERVVALKLIRPEIAAEEAFRARFRREAQLAASVDHPNVLPVYEADEADGLLFVAMRWVEGPDLRRVLRTEGPLAPTRAVHIVAQLAEALEAAHRIGLVHRDVKPANVLIEGDRLYLSDFGLARSLGAPDEMTATAGFVGTIDYAAPEVLDGAPMSSSADIYALGCLLFETLTGSVPYPAETLLAKLHAHAIAAPPKPSELRPELPVAFDAVVHRALDKNPARRFASARELAHAARSALETQPVDGAVRRARRHHVKEAAFAGAVALAAAAVALVALLASGERHATKPPARHGTSALHDSRFPAPAHTASSTAPARSGPAALAVCDPDFAGPPGTCRTPKGEIEQLGDKDHVLRMRTMDVEVTDVSTASTLQTASGALLSSPRGTTFVLVDLMVMNRTHAPAVFEPDTVAAPQATLWVINHGRVEPYRGPGGVDYSTQDVSAATALTASLARRTLAPGIPVRGELVFSYPTSELRGHVRAILELGELGDGRGRLASTAAVRLHL